MKVLLLAAATLVVILLQTETASATSPLPHTPSAPTVDGVCDDGAYWSALQLSIPVDGREREGDKRLVEGETRKTGLAAYLVETDHDVFICLANAPTATIGAARLSVYFVSGVYPFGLFAPYKAAGNEWAASFNPYSNAYDGLDPGRWEARRTWDTKAGHWSAEFRISKILMDTNTISIAAGYENYPGAGTSWFTPSGANPVDPNSWTQYTVSGPYLGLSRPSIDFGLHGLGVTSQAERVWVENLGAGQLFNGLATIGGADASSFSVAVQGCAYTVFPPFGNPTCQVDVVCTPNHGGPLFAYLELTSNAVGNKRVDLYCWGFPAA